MTRTTVLCFLLKISPARHVLVPPCSPQTPQRLGYDVTEAGMVQHGLPLPSVRKVTEWGIWLGKFESYTSQTTVRWASATKKNQEIQYFPPHNEFKITVLYFIIVIHKAWYGLPTLPNGPIPATPPPVGATPSEGSADQCEPRDKTRPESFGNTGRRHISWHTVPATRNVFLSQREYDPNLCLPSEPGPTTSCVIFPKFTLCRHRCMFGNCRKDSGRLFRLSLRNKIFGTERAKEHTWRFAWRFSKFPSIRWIDCDVREGKEVSTLDTWRYFYIRLWTWLTVPRNVLSLTCSNCTCRE